MQFFIESGVQYRPIFEADFDEDLGRVTITPKHGMFVADVIDEELLEATLVSSELDGDDLYFVTLRGDNMSFQLHLSKKQLEELRIKIS